MIGAPRGQERKRKKEHESNTVRSNTVRKQHSPQGRQGRSAMLLGFNTNYRYRGVLFHVQTEDSGVENPHVITHLFHGGNIMASRKGDYSDKLDSADLEGDVRGLMQRQHRAMLKGLQGGEFDPVIAQRLGGEAFPDATDTADTKSELRLEPVPDGAEPPAAVDAPPPASSSPSARAELPAAPTAEGAPAAVQARGAASADDGLNRAFGEGVVSEKPLDEVVLEYLVENARKRKRRSR